jgi:hypothetical protein
VLFRHTEDRFRLARYLGTVAKVQVWADQ